LFRARNARLAVAAGLASILDNLLRIVRYHLRRTGRLRSMVSLTV
jgi:hypothetical protein